TCFSLLFFLLRRHGQVVLAPESRKTRHEFLRHVKPKINTDTMYECRSFLCGLELEFIVQPNERWPRSDRSYLYTTCLPSD
ncbi:hypothetical protein BJY52DRAFT_1285044, partial [Lactarius psammicola]